VTDHAADPARPVEAGTRRIPRPAPWEDDSEAALDAHHVRCIRAALREIDDDVVIRLECFSRPEADRYRALLTEAELKRVFFAWVFD
jgi:hypothetical protein